jgi:hypothetical protein
MEKTINVLELADELATKEMLRLYGEGWLFEDTDGVFRVKEGFEEEFNFFYDYYYDSIVNL